MWGKEKQRFITRRCCKKRESNIYTPDQHLISWREKAMKDYFNLLDRKQQQEAQRQLFFGSFKATANCMASKNTAFKIFLFYFKYLQLYFLQTVHLTWPHQHLWSLVHSFHSSLVTQMHFQSLATKADFNLWTFVANDSRLKKRIRPNMVNKAA